MNPRRKFLTTSSAALTAILVPSATAIASGHADTAGPEDIAAIRQLWESYVAGVANDGTALGRVLQDPARPRDSFQIAPDRKSATARFHCLVQIAEPLTGHGSLIEMARLQGNRETRWERGVHELECSNTAEGWRIQRVAYRPAARGIVTFEPSSPL